MKKWREIAVTFAIVGIISLIFWHIGWLASAKDIFTLFIITAAVIALDIFAAWGWKKLKHWFSK